MLQCVAVCRIVCVLQSVTVCCSMLQCVAVLQGVAGCHRMLHCGCVTRVDAAGFCTEQCVAVRCSAVQLCVSMLRMEQFVKWRRIYGVLRCIALHCGALHCIAGYCSALQRIAVCCSAL